MKSIRLFLISFWFVLGISKIFADPSALHTFKGLGAVITNPKFNPIVGAVAESYLKGIRYFGAYGENKEKENPLLKCIVKNRTNPQDNTPLPDNCPQDVVTSLIQWLFPNATMDGNFAPNRRDPSFKDLVSHFTPSTIGSILNEIAKAKDVYSLNLADNIAKALLEDYYKSKQEVVPEKKIDPAELKKEFEEKFNKITTPQDSYKTFANVIEYLEMYSKLNNTEKQNIKNPPTIRQIITVKAYQKALNPNIKKQKPSTLTQQRKIDPEYEEQAKLFAKIVVAGLNSAKKTSEPQFIEEKIEEEKNEISSNNSLIQNFSQSESYYPNIVEMALLHFGWTISKDKKDIVSLLIPMNTVVNTDQLNIYAKSTDVYTEENYLELKKNFSNLDSLNGSSGLELAALLGFGYQYFEVDFPEKIGYTIIPLFKEKYNPNNPKQEKHEVSGRQEIADCGESSLRTVLMFLLFDFETKTFNISDLEKKAEELKQLKIHPLLVEFFKTHFSPDSSQTYGARVDWMRTTSFLENDIEYVKHVRMATEFTKAPVCEIEAGLGNMMKVLGVLLGLKPSPPEKENLIDMTPLNTLLELISPKDNQWKWQDSGGKTEISKEENKNVHIDFYRHKKKIFTWLFKSGHFDTVVHVSEGENWLNSIGVKLLESKEILPAYFPLLVNESFMPEDLNKLNLNLENKSLLFYSRDLKDNNAQMKMLEEIAVSPSGSFMILGKRLIDSLKMLAQADGNAKQKIIKNSFKSTQLGLYVIDAYDLTWNENLIYKQAPLSIAIQNQNGEIIKHLIEKGVDANQVDVNQIVGVPRMSILFLAARFNNIEFVKYLVEKKSNVNLKSYLDQTPLHAAAESRNLEIVKYLIDNKADVNATDNIRETPLHKAASRENLEIIKYLIEKGALINARNWKHSTPLHNAVISGNLEVIKYLLEAGANIEAEGNSGNTPLHTAADVGKLDVVKYLLDKKANIQARNDAGSTPLHLVAYTGQLGIVKYLLDKKANIEANNRDGFTPLHTATYTGRLDIVKYLLDKKANIEAKTSNLLTPLHLARELDVVKYLVELKADMNAKDRYGRTPLDNAIIAEKKDIVEYLQQKMDEMKK